ncbi:phosphatidylethanolamine N-methyltransferase [Basidiobolus ranarum]|uniref:Phosphatidylethanolamine N-methyltransferase n=1 Tax=Basidiobolus ranarum TaxID=34480 RepID=A0ABR2WED1_9FUNG
MHDQLYESFSEKGVHITYARTFNGKAFRMPYVPDVLTTLFDPEVEKSIAEYLTLLALFGQITLFFILSEVERQSFFIYSFLFWRLLHQFGIGLLLRYQSTDNGLVRFVEQSRCFTKESSYNKLVTSVLKSKMGEDYVYEQAPIEFNTWLLFRQLVDSIIVNGFFSYVCFALSFFYISPESTIFQLTLRWGIGISLVVFQLRTQLSLQSSPQNHSMYWANFFFQSERRSFIQENKWTSLFYNVGYVGYYGMSLITSSYTVLYGSLFAHVTQLLFLLLVENPHTSREYHKTHESADNNTTQDFSSSLAHLCGQTVLALDLFRSADLFVLLIVLYCAILTPIVSVVSDSVLNWFLVAHCIIWRLIHSGGLGVILYFQKKRGFWIKHFENFGSGARDGFENWTNVYHLSLSMTYTSMLLVAFNSYTIPTEWNSDTLTRHVIGLFLLLLHIWVAASTFELMGSYGWFYGDLFFDINVKQPELAIHRMNVDADTFRGQAAALGLSILVNNCCMYIILLVSFLANGLFLLLIEESIASPSSSPSTSKNPLHSLRQNAFPLVGRVSS